MENSFDKTAIETIDLLEARLRRIEFALGDQPSEVSESNNKVPTAKRLADIEHCLHQIASKSRAVQELLTLHAKHPDLFQSISADELPTTLDTSSILSIVLASATSYPSTSSRLTSILEVPVPSAELSAQLIDLQPRIAKVAALQAAQNTEMAALRERTAAVIQRWYTVDILTTGESWAEIEGRFEGMEQKLRRAVLEKQQDDMI